MKECLWRMYERLSSLASQLPQVADIPRSSWLASEGVRPANAASGILDLDLIELMIKGFKPRGPGVHQHFQVAVEYCRTPSRTLL